MNIQEWKRSGKPQVSFRTGKGDTMLAMEVAEDFLYLISSSSANNIQVSINCPNPYKMQFYMSLHTIWSMTNK